MIAATSGRRSGAASLGVLLLIYGAHIINDGMSATLSALLPTLQLRFELSEAVLAMLVAVLSFSSSVTQPLLGAVADRVGLRSMAAGGVMLSAALLSLLALAPSVPLAVLVLLAGGLGSAAFHPAGSSLARAAGGRFKELAVASFSSTGTLGLALGPVVILWLARSDALGYAPLLMLPGLALGALLLRILPAQRHPQSTRPRPRLFDPKLFFGPVGMLSVAGILRSLAYVAFSSAMPLWLASRGAAPDAPVISATLALFSVSAGVGALLAGLLATRRNRTALMVVSMLLALPALLATQWVASGGVAYYLLVAAGGALSTVALPIMVVVGQDLAPEAMGTASGMMLGFTWGVAGVLYIGVGWLQELIGVGYAIGLAYFTLIPAAVLTLYVMRRYRPG